MIKINLLPQEYRKKERTSFKVFGSLLLSLIVVCASFVYFGHVYLNEFKVIEAKRVSKEEKLKNLEVWAKRDDALVSERKEYEKRSKTIQKIANSRLLWTKTLDQFIDITFNEGNTERHWVWFSNLSANTGSGRRGPTMTLAAKVATGQFSRQANYLDDLKNDKEFFKDFLSVNAPGGRVVMTEKKEPQAAISFKLDLRMKPSSLWAKNQKKK